MRQTGGRANEGTYLALIGASDGGTSEWRHFFGLDRYVGRGCGWMKALFWPWSVRRTGVRANEGTFLALIGTSDGGAGEWRHFFGLDRCVG